MKKLISLISILVSLNCTAQLAPYPRGSYVLDPDLDKFVGTWRWVSDTDTMTIVLQKQKIYYPAPFYFHIDQLVGWHKYVKNGVLVESSLEYVGIPFDSGHFTLHGSTVNATSVRFTGFRDISKHKRSDNLFFTLAPQSLTEANWLLRNSQGLKSGGFDFRFTVPTSMLFIKQSPSIYLSCLLQSKLISSRS